MKTGQKKSLVQIRGNNKPAACNPALFYRFFSFTIICLLLACSQRQAGSEGKEESEPETVSLLGDRNFENGLSLRGNDSGNPLTGKFLTPYGESGQEPVWLLAEWGSKYLLQQDVMVEKSETKVYENQGKLISFKRTDEGMNIRMDVKTSAEYQQPRKPNEFWPHLLIEQGFSEMPRVDDLKNLFLFFEGRLLYSRSFMDKKTFNPDLHTAQFQLFLTVQDRNLSSPGYGDYLWFGVPFYDFRYPVFPRYAAQDFAKDDATGKFIYSLGSKDYTEESFHNGAWVIVEKDLKPHIDEALKMAKERGYLAESNPEDFRITGMNLGWEVPGTFDAAFELKGFDLRCVTVGK